MCLKRSCNGFSGEGLKAPGCHARRKGSTFRGDRLTQPSRWAKARMQRTLALRTPPRARAWSRPINWIITPLRSILSNVPGQLFVPRNGRSDVRTLRLPGAAAWHWACVVLGLVLVRRLRVWIKRYRNRTTSASSLWTRKQNSPLR